MTTIKDRPAETKPQAFKVVGTRPIRHDGWEKVTGQAKYASDVQLPGMLFGKILRSPHAHARIRSIDVSKASAMSGVRAVITARDFPIIDDSLIDFGETMGNARLIAESCMASGKALYKGHPVAAVAADSVHIAEAALARIAVDYEVLPHVLDVRAAMRDDAPRLHESLTTRESVARGSKGDDTGRRSNIASHLQLKRGDLIEGYAAAAVVVEREFVTESVHQGYIEPQSSTASVAADGRITIWTSTQSPFVIRASTAVILGVSESQVKVVPQEIGGGFGGKTVTYVDPLVVLMAKKTGKPVKLTFTRKEVLETAGPAEATYMRCKMGVDALGKITAAELYLAYAGGAYPGAHVGGGSTTGLAPYNIPNLQVDGFDVVCNRPRTAAYRAPGSSQAALAVESVVDELAQKLDMDPLDLRLRNASKEGDRQPSGVLYPRIGGIELVQIMQSHPHYKSPLGGPNRGRGVALGYWHNGGNNSTAVINVNADGTISLITGSVDIGGTRAAVAMQAAEVLGIRAEDVHPTVADTDSIGWTGATGGSRTAFSTGIAAITAAEYVRDQMLRRMALLWEVNDEDVSFADGVFVCAANGKRMTFKEAAAKLMSTGGPVSATGVSNPKRVGPAVCGTLVDVEVDSETGKTTILRATVFQDAGKAVHPSYVEGQMQGGTVQGIGWALNEEYVYAPDGTLLNSSLLDYRTPTALDLPMIDTVIVEVPNPGHPFGLRGVGEVSIVPPLAAVANAVSRAIGVRMCKLPISPAVILGALDSSLLPSV